MLFSGLFIIVSRSGALTAALVLVGAIAIGCVLVLWLGSNERERKSRAALKAAARRADSKVRKLLVRRRDEPHCRAEIQPPDFGTEEDDDASEEGPV